MSLRGWHDMSVAEADVADRGTPASRRRLLEEMGRAREELEKAVAAIPRDRLETPGAWGPWTLKDLVAHIAAYERWTSEQMEIQDASQELRESVQEETTGGVDGINRMIYDAHRDDALDDVLSESRAAYDALRASIERKSEEELGRPAWFSGTGTLLAFLPEQSYGHYRDHLADLRAAGSPSDSYD
jgi:uncharacterized damage-inducible protein DinB